MPEEEHEELKRRGPAWAWAMAALTLVGMGGGGWALMVFVQRRDALSAVLGPWPWHEQLAAGAVLGLLIAAVAWRIISAPAMQHIRTRYAGIVAAIMPGALLQAVVSVCAGVGEELLFRGAVQHWLGIPLTAALFVAIHGYLDPRDRGMLRYGLFMTLAMCALGWGAERAGLLLPMAAHAVIDAVLIRRLVGGNGSDR
jgi:membrane protease YdiL (CAAX protease family)